MSIRERLESVRSRIAGAAQRAGRRAADITLVAVSKGAAIQEIVEAGQAGLSVFGENKVQEAVQKIPAVSLAELQWHMVGHLQSNKVKDAVALFHLIQSVDTVRVAEKISQEAVLAGKTMPVLLEVNVSGEQAKYGFKSEEIYSAVDSVVQLPNIKVLGLMGMAPDAADPAPRRAAFKMLKGLFGVCKTMKYPALEMKYLSMGMSDDFEIAIEEGSNMVRIGRAIFR